MPSCLARVLDTLLDGLVFYFDTVFTESFVGCLLKGSHSVMDIVTIGLSIGFFLFCAWLIFGLDRL